MISHRSIGQKSNSIVLPKSLVEEKRVKLALLLFRPRNGKVILNRVEPRVVIEKVLGDLTLHFRNFYSAIITQVTFKCIFQYLYRTVIGFEFFSLFYKYGSVGIPGKSVAIYKASRWVCVTASR